ncbi:MAG: hypothetical protein WDZ91_15945 [Paenibacillaceae bacterium]
MAYPDWLEESYCEEWKNAGYGDVNELHREVPLQALTRRLGF